MMCLILRETGWEGAMMEGDAVAGNFGHWEVKKYYYVENAA